MVDNDSFIEKSLSFSTLTDENNNQYKLTDIKSENIKNEKTYNSIIKLSYPITTYDNINNLYLHLVLDETKIIDIKLYK